MVVGAIHVWQLQTYEEDQHVDDEILAAAKDACGAATDTQTVRLGLEALIRRAAYQRLRALVGSEPTVKDVPRRRKPVGSPRKSSSRVA